ncbi:hypothetical protein G6F65_018195 [Rhizopus arrhizus]|nr:hypothetical protein G6F65_018195 [Rhizopus arrhizus]
MSFYLVAPFVLHSPRRLIALLAASLALRAVLVATARAVPGWIVVAPGAAAALQGLDTAHPPPAGTGHRRVVRLLPASFFNRSEPQRARRAGSPAVRGPAAPGVPVPVAAPAGQGDRRIKLSHLHLPFAGDHVLQLAVERGRSASTHALCGAGDHGLYRVLGTAERFDRRSRGTPAQPVAQRTAGPRASAGGGCATARATGSSVGIYSPRALM